MANKMLNKIFQIKVNNKCSAMSYDELYFTILKDMNII